jgi:hypothetical protein
MRSQITAIGPADAKRFQPSLLGTLAIFVVGATLISACSILGPRAEVGGCPVTAPNGSTPPGEHQSELNHGNGQLWTALWPEGTVVFRPNGPGEVRADGSLAMKFPWWRGDGVRGQLEIEGRLLDREGPDAYGEVPAGYGETGFQASGIVFSGVGCWEVTGRVGDAELTFVQRVVRNMDE